MVEFLEEVDTLVVVYNLVEVVVLVEEGIHLVVDLVGLIL